jgi:phage baseplate assembly protein W
VDIDAVKNSVRNLILSNYFDRPFQPALGSNVSAFLFEPADNFTISAMREEIKRVLKKFEPRVDSVTVEVIDNSDRNAYDITVGFRVIALDQRVDMTLYLKRIR